MRSGSFNSLEKPLDPESVLDSQYLKIRFLRVLRVLCDSDNSTIECPDIAVCLSRKKRRDQ